MLTQSANALERIANRLASFASTRPNDDRLADLLDESACELAHHADAIREASGLNAAIDANLDSIKGNL